MKQALLQMSSSNLLGESKLVSFWGTSKAAGYDVVSYNLIYIAALLLQLVCFSMCS